MTNKRVIVAMSGGLDSSAASKILKDQGYEVLGVFIRLGLDQADDENHARKVCHYLGVDFYPVNAADHFRKEIIDYFVDSYAQGLTPNPCIKCNQAVKFRELTKLADVLGFSRVATGHYARVVPENNTFHLLRGRDKTKDQSYFLYKLTQNELKRTLFPLGEYKKEDIRELSQKQGLPFLDSESQDICFISGDHNDLLRKKIDLTPGPIKILDGKTVGEHKGLPLYTIGQRRGVEVGGIGPLYVVRPDYENNILYVTNDSNDPALFSSKVTIKNSNWIAGQEPDLPRTYGVVTRYGQEEQKAAIKKGSEKEEYIIEFQKPQRAITPGQSAVFYENGEVVGGGVIRSGDQLSD